MTAFRGTPSENQSMYPINEKQLQLTRRQLLTGASGTLGVAALANLLGDGGAAADLPSESTGALPGLPHFAPKVRRIIYLMQTGAPSHVDLFDHKPGLP